MRPLALALLLAGCAGKQAVDPQIVYRDVPMQVATPCVVDRPSPPQKLKDRIPDAVWATKPPGAKAQAVRAQALARMNYEDHLAAATSGCPEKGVTP